MVAIAGQDKQRQRDLNRSWVVRIGKRLRKHINPAIKKYSQIGDSPVFDNANFEWLKSLEENWVIIRDEAENILRYQDAIPPIAILSPDHKKLDAKNRWLSYFLWGYGYKSEENCRRCPETTQIVQAIPGMTTALFSIHKPGKIIKPHKGVTAGVCVCHLGLIIPEDSQNCAIKVSDKTIHWKPGKAFVFDDTYRHETWNNTQQTRVILLVHFKRPLRLPGSILAGAFMWAIQHTSFIQDAVNNMKLWEVQFKNLEARENNSAENTRS